MADGSRTCMTSLRSVPPLREVPLRRTGARSVVRGAVEQHQARANGIPELDDVEAGGRLLESIPVATAVEAEQAAEHEPERGLVRHNEDAFVRMSHNDLPDHRERTGEHRHTRLATPRRKGIGIALPVEVFLWMTLLDLMAREAFPVAVVDLAQAVAPDRREAMRARKDQRRVDGAAERAAVDRAELLGAEALGQPRGLISAFLGELDARGPREAVLRGELRRAVADEIQARAHCGVFQPPTSATRASASEGPQVPHS